MKRERGKQWLALLLGVGLTLSLAGCLDGGGSGGDGGATVSKEETDVSTGETTMIKKVKTDATTGEATVGNNTYVLVDAAGETQKGVELTVDTKTGIAEVISSDYTYNAVQTNAKGKTVIFVQKVDPKQKPYEGDLDKDCPAFSEAIGVSIDGGEPPMVGKVAASNGLFKPTPKTLKSSNGKAEVVVSEMHLGKDITVSVTPYQADNFVPLKDHIASQIGVSQATVLAGADINIVDSKGTPTTAEAACLSGKMILKASNQLTPWDVAAIQSAIDSKDLKLVVFKDKKWQMVNATIAVEEAGITIKNAAVLLRLYSFVFVKVTAAGETFTVKGTVKVSGSPEGSALASTATEIPLAGATVQASWPHVLNTLTVDNSTGLVTIGKAGWSGPLSYQYAWHLFQITNGTTDFGIDLLANLEPPASGSTSNGAASLTVDDQVKNKMTSDGQYLLQVSACGASQPQGLYSQYVVGSVLPSDCEQQSGQIVKKGTTYTVQMNPTAETALSTTSGSDGAYSLSGLFAAYKTSYAITPSKDGYKGWAQPIVSSDDISSGTLTKDLWMQKVVVTTTTTTTNMSTTTTSATTSTTNMVITGNGLLNGLYAFVTAGNKTPDGPTGNQQWLTSFGTMTFNGAGGWSEVFTANQEPGGVFSGTLPASGSGMENYEVMEGNHLSLWGSDITAAATGGVNTAGSNGDAVFFSDTQREPIFFSKMGGPYNYASDLMDSSWFFVSYNPVGFYSWHDRISFGSLGFTSPSGNFIPSSGVVTLTGNGAFTLPGLDVNQQPLANPHDCALSAAKDVALCGQVKTPGQPVTVIGVKLASNPSVYSVAAAAGTYHTAGSLMTATGTQALSGTLSLDGTGGWSGSFLYSDSASGQSGQQSFAPSGTYTYDGPSNPGRYTLTQTSPSPATIYCGASADGGTVVCHRADTGTIGIYMGVRQ